MVIHNCERLLKTREVNSIVDRILANRDKYQKAQNQSGVPWSIIAVIHSLEASLNFNTHLHNGDPLSQKTVQVPKGRPSGNPPFTWETSAADALEWEGMTKWRERTIPGALFVLERFNGSGYNQKGMTSPYLWSFSNNYKKGKFVKDGVFDPEAVSKQCGAAVLLKTMSERGIDLGLNNSGIVPSDKPLDWDEVGKLTAQKAVSIVGSRLFASVTAVQQLLLDSGIVPSGLQPGFVDGKWGKHTSDVLIKFQKSKNLFSSGVMDAATGAKMFPDKGKPETAVLEKGKEGDDVKKLQSGLIKLGYMEMEKIGGGFGKFGPQTETAVEVFQKHLSLVVTGKAGELEQKLLESIQNGIGRDNPNTQIIKAIQDQFVKLTYLTQTQINTGYGTFGPQTETAVKKFQHDNLLQESGIVEATTFKVLFNQTASGKEAGDEFFTAKDGEHYTVAEGILMTKSLQEKVEKVANLYFAGRNTKLVITSGYRPPSRQAPAMYDKIADEGEANVRKLYKNKVAVEEILTAYRVNKRDKAAAVEAITDVIEKQMKRGVYISSHLLSNAVDVRMTADIKALKDVVIRVGGRIIVELNHFHLELH